MTMDAVTRLAAVVSLAARIEPELLRAARLRLLPDVNASAEGDLWFSDLVASRSARRVLLDPTVASSLRESLANDPAMLNAARAVVAETHADAPPAIQLEEEILYLALTGAGVADAINTKLTSVLSAIANEGRRGLIDWAARALPAMPVIVQNTTAAAALRLVAGGQKQTSDAVHVSRDPALAALVDRALPKTNVFARLVPREAGGTCVEISHTQRPESHEIELPKTKPLIVELTTMGRTEVVEVPSEGELLREMERVVSIRTIARDVFRLEELSEETARTTVRILAMTRLAMRELTLPAERDIDVVLISDVPEWAADESDYIYMADRLRNRFGDVPILAAPGETDRRNILGFEAFRARVGFTSDRSEFGKTLTFSRGTLAIIGIDNVLFGEDYPSGSFSASQISNACGGDPLGWAHQHDVAILLMSHKPATLTPESLQKWEAFGAEDVFDLVISGADIPKQSQGFILIEVDLGSGVITPTTHRLEGIETGDPTHARPRRHSFERRVEPRRVLVAGVAEGLSIQTQELSRAIGSLLALQGHDLITGGWPGVDYLVAEGFDTAASNRADSIAHYFGGLRKEPDSKHGHRIFFEREEDALSAAVGATDIVILIEGADGTHAVGREAISQGKPVIPIGGGAAAELRDIAIRPGRWADNTRERLRGLRGPASVATIVHDVNELIRVARPRERKQLENVFISHSEDSRIFTQFEYHAEQLIVDSARFLRDIASLSLARFAVVFIGPGYLEDRRKRDELRRIVDRATAGHLTIFWFLESRCDYASTGIDRFKAAHDITKPLDTLSVEEFNEVYQVAAEEFAKLLHASVQQEEPPVRVTAEPKQILVVDADSSWLETIELILRDSYDLKFARNPDEALSIARSWYPPLAILDWRISTDTSGLQLLTRLRDINPELRAIILTGFAEIEDAVESIKSGAIDYLSKGRADLAGELRKRVEKALADQTAVMLLLRRGESDTLEFKSTLRWDFKQQRINRDLEGVVVKTIAGFLNSAGGGTLLVGVGDAGNPIGLQYDYETLKTKDRDGFEAFLFKLLLDAYGRDIAPFLHIDFHEVEGKDVCRVVAKPSPRPIYVVDSNGKDHLFIRTGNTTRELSARETVEYSKIRWK